MAPFRELNNPLQQGQRYIKKGQIHSEKALKRRAEKWMEKWSSVVELSNHVLERLNLNDEKNDISIDDHSYSASPESVKGFKFQEVHDCVTIYGMTREQIQNLEMEENLTTDEDDDNDEEEDITVSLNLKYSLKDNGLKLYPPNRKKNSGSKQSDVRDNILLYNKNFKVDPELSSLQPDGNVDDDGDDDDVSTSSSEIININYDLLSIGENISSNENKDNYDADDGDPDIQRTRPISRISLLIPPYDNGGDVDDDDDDLSDCETERPLSRMSHSGYTTYFETDEEDSDGNDTIKERIIKPKKSSQGVYGKIPGVNIGTIWKNRRQFSRRSVHRPHTAIVHGGPNGAYSMVLSATYSVNDRGEEFDFYGEGGRDQKSKKHVRDQKMTRGNLSLRENIQTGTPVRVIRGYQLQNDYAPEAGYRYDGLYAVTQCTMDQKIDGFKVFMFTFARCANQLPPPWNIAKFRLPLPSPSTVDQHLSTSSTDSDDDKVNGNVRPKRPNRRKRRKTMVPDVIRSSTPLSTISDDSPPSLELPENNEHLIVYPIPPRLSIGVCISNDFLDIQKRPVLCLDKLHDDILTEALKRPVNVENVRLINSLQEQFKNCKLKEEEQVVKRKSKDTLMLNQTSALSAKIFKKAKTKNVSNVQRTTKNISNKVKNLQNKSKDTVRGQISIKPMKKKSGRQKVSLPTKKKASEKHAMKIKSNMAIKKRRHPKIALTNKTKVNKSGQKGSAKKGISVQPIKKRRLPKGSPG
ncbi:hypothetical protein L9F63_026381 [Diploptera punctata]|uniref:YDG domain-containing protein n=1 Tax=Diploptera punctata TaxID=6984 RepID=A0AAD8AIR8_DIPPU|nr:hypothetical protein L9F63_026381 [Diploptera punctata]